MPVKSGDDVIARINAAKAILAVANPDHPSPQSILDEHAEVIQDDKQLLEACQKLCPDISMSPSSNTGSSWLGFRRG